MVFKMKQNDFQGIKDIIRISKKFIDLQKNADIHRLERKVLKAQAKQAKLAKEIKHRTNLKDALEDAENNIKRYEQELKRLKSQKF